MAFVDDLTGRIRLGWDTGSSYVFLSPTTGTLVGDIAIALDDLSDHYIVWVEQATSDLMLSYISSVDGQFQYSTTTLDPDTYVDGSVSLVIDSSNVLHIAYYDATNGDLKYATGTLAGGFTYEVVDSNADVGIDSDITLDSNGKPHIAYYDATTGDVKYAHK